MKPKRVSVLITTYNKPRELVFALKSLLNQTRLPDEIVVADDGSREETGEAMRSFCQGCEVPIPIIRAWQEDIGWRVARSRNNAIAVASGDYIIAIDGDCFVERHFVEDHLFFSKKNRCVGGRRVEIRKWLKETVLESGEARITPFTFGIFRRRNAIRSLALARLCSRELSPKGDESFFENFRHSIQTANFAFWREDAIAVNGFNEFFQMWGPEDVEFARRLELNGAKRFIMRQYGLAYHFRHPKAKRASEDEKIRPRTPAYLETLESEFRCKNGVNRALERVKAFVRPEKGFVQFDF
ncbi:MAG: glycosyltransferase [Thermoguttaceae bacterium]|nr:glycosyltransferase [Thermoguttaceae bacterium]